MGLNPHVAGSPSWKWAAPPGVTTVKMVKPSGPKPPKKGCSSSQLALPTTGVSEVLATPDLAGSSTTDLHVSIFVSFFLVCTVGRGKEGVNSGLIL